MIELDPFKGIYVKRFDMSDFDLRVKKEGRSLAFFPVPVETARDREGHFRLRRQEIYGA